MPWYALYTKPRNEKKLAQLLQAKGIEVYCPVQEIVRQWSDRKKKVLEPVFSSYVFVFMNNYAKERIPVLETPGAVNFPHIDGFERDIESFYDNKIHAAALSSCTAAIHLALILLGVQAGDEVICQSFTFIASANPIMYLGANPVFVDSEADTWNMSPHFLEMAIKDRMANGKKPKAIVVVHLYGMAANMPQIMEIAKTYNIPILEDAAEALGSSINGQKCGTFADISVLSFNGNKIITSSGGGALISANPQYTEHAKFLASQARDPAPYYQHSSLGYNYRMSNISASIGRGQILYLKQRIQQRKAIYNYYYEQLSHLPGLSFLNEPIGYYSNRWLTTILINPLQSGGVTNILIADALATNDIESRRLWKPLAQQPLFHNCPSYGNGMANQLFETGLCLPSGSSLTLAQLNKIVGIIIALWH